MIFAGMFSGGFGAAGASDFGCSAAGSGATTRGPVSSTVSGADSLGASRGRTILPTGPLATAPGRAAGTFAPGAAGVCTTTGSGAFRGAALLAGAAATGDSIG